MTSRFALFCFQKQEEVSQRDQLDRLLSIMQPGETLAKVCVLLWMRAGEASVAAAQPCQVGLVAQQSSLEMCLIIPARGSFSHDASF